MAWYVLHDRNFFTTVKFNPMLIIMKKFNYINPKQQRADKY